MNADLEIIVTAASVLIGALLGIGTLAAACFLTLALVWIVYAALTWLPPITNRAYLWISQLLTTRRARTETPALSGPARIDLVAAAIAGAAGHNWAAAMMPEYRAEFRQQARAAIAAQEDALWR